MTKGFLMMGWFPTNPKPTTVQFYDGGQFLRKCCALVSLYIIERLLLLIVLPRQYELAIAEGEIALQTEVFTTQIGHSLCAYHWTPVDYWCAS